jgi:hypothetical protein
VSLEVETSIQIQQQQMGEEMVKEEKGNRKYWKVGVGAVGDRVYTGGAGRQERDLNK